MESARSRATAYNYQTRFVELIGEFLWRQDADKRELYKVFRLSGKPGGGEYDLQSGKNYRANFSSFQSSDNEIFK